MTALLPDALAETISELVEEKYGLHYPRERWAELADGIRAAAAEHGFSSPFQYAERFAAADLESAQAHALAENLTVGETYFFREPSVFETLISSVIPRLAAQRSGHGRRLRIWSAGCCTGEEAYSIAIALRLALPDLEEWQITILATDINPHFLRKAAAGVFGEWSFRGVAEEVRQAWFQRTPEGRYAIRPAIRQMVTFTCLNLAEDAYPSLVNNTNAMDLIFCRHVLMYFSAARQRKAIEHLHASLASGGLLLVSAAEASPALAERFTHAGFPGLPLYGKGPAPAVPIIATPPRIEPPRPTPAPASPPPPRDHALEARALANEGRLAAALAACDRALLVDRLIASHHYLRGVILQEQNDLEPAAAALQRALYLDPEFAVAYFALGHLRLRQGREEEAARCFANARSVLAKLDPDAMLPESDGITAGRLLAILNSTEEVLA